MCLGEVSGDVPGPALFTRDRRRRGASSSRPDVSVGAFTRCPHVAVPSCARPSRLSPRGRRDGRLRRAETEASGVLADLRTSTVLSVSGSTTAPRGREPAVSSHQPALPVGAAPTSRTRIVPVSLVRRATRCLRRASPAGALAGGLRPTAIRSARAKDGRQGDERGASPLRPVLRRSSPCTSPRRCCCQPRRHDVRAGTVVRASRPRPCGR